MLIRRVRADEWERIRDQRLEALRDPLADLAFLETYDEAAARPDQFWIDRAEGAAAGGRVAQFVVEDERGEWVASAAVLLFRAGERDYYDQPVTGDRVNVVGVFVRPELRGQGLLASLLDECETWALAQGIAALTMDVNDGNVPARRAYERLGFTDTGDEVISDHGRDLQMRRAIDGPSVAEPPSP